MKCVYCKDKATGKDALGLDACVEHASEADDYTREHHPTPLQSMIARLGVRAGIAPTIFEASKHKYSCRCELCLEWWRGMGPDPDTDSYGPFTDEEIK